MTILVNKRIKSGQLATYLVFSCAKAILGLHLTVLRALTLESDEFPTLATLKYTPSQHSVALIEFTRRAKSSLEPLKRSTDTHKSFPNKMVDGDWPIRQAQRQLAALYPYFAAFGTRIFVFNLPILSLYNGSEYYFESAEGH